MAEPFWFEGLLWKDDELPPEPLVERTCTQRIYLCRPVEGCYEDWVALDPEREERIAALEKKYAAEAKEQLDHIPPRLKGAKLAAYVRERKRLLKKAGAD